jgi:hypothetical protein
MFIKFGDKTPIINVRNGKPDSSDKAVSKDTLYLDDDDRRAEAINTSAPKECDKAEEEVDDE